MARFVFTRLVHAIPTLFLTSVAIFVLLRVIPGDPSLEIAGPDSSPETLAAIRASLGLDQPVAVQYLAWLGHVLMGDLGQSTLARRPVADLILLALPATLQLSAAALLVAMVVGGALGTVAALRRGRWPDLLINTVTALLIGIPSFWLGLLAIMLFGLVLGWLPPGGRVDPLQDPALGLRSLVLPAAVLGLARAAVLARFTRAALLEVLAQPHLLTARAKGLVSWRVFYNHAFRSGLIPLATILGIETGHLLGGALVIETVFAWPGMGRLVIGAMNGRDYSVIQAVVLVLVGAFVIVNLVVDLMYAVLDPRVRLAE